MSIQGKQFRTEITEAGELKLSLETVDFRDPKDDEVLVKVGASQLIHRILVALWPCRYESGYVRWHAGCANGDSKNS